jgi:hypothetical protein
MLNDEEADVVAEPSKYLNVHAHENKMGVYFMSVVQRFFRVVVWPPVKKSEHIESKPSLRQPYKYILGALAEASNDQRAPSTCESDHDQKKDSK